MSLAKHESSEKQIKFVPPDGGWGWMVFLGVTLVNMVCMSLIPNFGLLFGERLRYMGHNTTDISFLHSCMFTIYCFSGILTGPIMKQFSCRQVAMAGSLFVFIGYSLTSLTTELWQMIITYSFFAGVGFGFFRTTNFIILDLYFSKRKRLAVGISMAGSGFGQMLIPYLINCLSENYGFNGCVLIIGACSLHSMIAVSLYQPVKWHMKHVEDPEKIYLKVDSETKPIENRNEIQHPSEENLNNKLTSSIKVVSIRKENGKFENFKDDEELPNTSCISQCWSSIFRLLDLDLLQDPLFINILIGLGIIQMTSGGHNMIFPIFILNGLNMTHGQAADCLTIAAGFDIVGRIIAPLITTRLKLSNRLILLLGATLMFLSRIVLALQSDYFGLLIWSAVAGFIRSITWTNFFLALREYIPQEKLPAAMGLNQITFGCMSLTLGPAFGYLRDYTNSYRTYIITASMLGIITMGIWALELIYCDRRKFKSNESSSK